MPLPPPSWRIVISCSENVVTLTANVASVVERSGLPHGLAIGDTLPNARRHVLAVLHGVLLHLFDVALLGRAIPVTDALVIARVQRITLLERSK